MKEFLTANDIEDLVGRGVRQIPISEDIVLTDLARERAAQLGVALVDRATAMASAPRSADRREPVYTAPLPTKTSAPANSSLGSKPRGCLHGHIETGGAAPEPAHGTRLDTGSPSGPVVDRLVEIVRQLSR